MRCARCQGLMVWDQFLDMAQADALWALAWRCINCGEVLDAVIEDHRRCNLVEPKLRKPLIAAKVTGLQPKRRRPGSVFAKRR